VIHRLVYKSCITQYPRHFVVILSFCCVFHILKAFGSFDFVEFSVFFKSLFSTEYAQCTVCRCVIELFVQQGTCDVSGLWSEPADSTLKKNAISSTCVHLIARHVVQHTCIITPKIINIRNRMYYSKKTHHLFLLPLLLWGYFLLTFLILISISGVETWHIIHLSHSTSFHFPDQKRVLRTCSVNYKLVFTKIQKYQK
jgi:hypothetical protein